MARLCLVKEARDKLVNAFRKGEISLSGLIKMKEEERRAVLEKYVGGSAKLVNATLEQALLSNQKNALARWVNSVTSEKDPVRKDMLKRIERVKKYLTPTEEGAIQEDLASMKLGINVSEEEVKIMLGMKKQVDELREKITDDMPDGSDERLAYGFAVDAFKQFVGEKKLEARAITLKERFLPKNWGRNFVDLAGITKSLLATADLSLIGRQAIKVLLSGDFKNWGKTVKDSFELFGKQLFAKSKGTFKGYDDSVMAGVRAYIYGSKNALNGKYTAAKNGYGLGVAFEEAFPSSKPELIPLLGRLFKGSETAFNGAALLLRKRLADAIIANAEQNGADMLDPQQATAHGSFVGSMTGRGEIGKAAALGKEINALFFSIRFLKSNFDTLTAHLFDRSMTPEARKLAALSTLKIAGSLGSILALAALLGFDVEPDPRSSKAGQICFGNRCIDITGGMRGLVTLASRLVPTYNNGEWGFWTKSGITGKLVNTTSGEFGQSTALDTLEQFFEGKLSPTAGALRDILRGQNFKGEKPNFVNTTIGLIIPISAQMLVEELKKGNDDALIALMAEAFGFSATDYTMQLYGKKWEQLKNKVDDKTLNTALRTMTDNFNEKADRLEQSPKWQRLDNAERAKEIDKIRTSEANKIFSRYNIK